MVSYSPRESAIAYARGLTADQLLARLAADGVSHPSRIAQYIGVSGRGTAREVAEQIVRQLGTETRTCRSCGSDERVIRRSCKRGFGMVAFLDCGHFQNDDEH